MATGITLDLGPEQGAPPQPEPAIDFLTLLNALRMLQDEQVAKEVPSRSLIPQVMHRLEQEARQGESQIQVTAFQQLLGELQSTDARCLDSLRQALPGIAQNLNRLRVEGLTVLEPGNVLGTYRMTNMVIQSQASWGAVERVEKGKRVIRLAATPIDSDEPTVWLIEAAVRPSELPGLDCPASYRDRVPTCPGRRSTHSRRDDHD